MTITKDSTPSKITKETYNYLKVQCNPWVRIGDLVMLIEKSVGQGIEIDLKATWDPTFSSQLLDFQKSYMTGEQLNLTEIKELIYKKLEISRSNIKMLEKNNFEDILWAIFMFISYPNNDYYKI